MEVRKKLTMILENLDCTQRKLSKDIGVSESCLHRWLYGKRFPNSCHLLILCKKFPNYFTKGEVLEWLSKK